MANRSALLLLAEQNRYKAADPVLQTAPWTCSAATMAWMLQSVGLQCDEDCALLVLGSHRINSALGLLDGTGAGMVDALLEIEEHARLIVPAPVSFDQVIRWAGKRAIGMGGGAWYHWVGVRGFDGQRLLLANPAPGYKGVQQTLDRGQFRALGPFYAVMIER